MNNFELRTSANVTSSRKVFDVIFKEIQIPQKCDFCGKQIADRFYYQINSESVCKCCLDRHFKEELIPYE